MSMQKIYKQNSFQNTKLCSVTPTEVTEEQTDKKCQTPNREIILCET